MSRQTKSQQKKSPKKTADFQWKPLSIKQKKVLTWWCMNSPYKDYDGIICDGAVRSGKTISMGFSFVNWAMATFSECDFALCGKTVGALRRNVLRTLKRQLYSAGVAVEERRSENMWIVSADGVTNYFYFFGGKDEASQDLIQGMTLAGVFFDEVALMPESFVTQAEARCSVEGAKCWYNCNPKNPKHYFKVEYIDKAAEKRLFYLHFTMEDNLTLSEKVKERYRRRFAGVFYQRNILGLWVTAEGKIYISFGKENIISKAEWYAQDADGKYTHPLRKTLTVVTMGVDFGGNGSAHAFNLTGFTAKFRQLITMKERRITEEIDPRELERRFCDFVRECKREYPQLVDIYCDSAEQVLIRGLKNAVRRERLAVNVKNAAKGEIIDRIRFYCMMQAQYRYFIVSDCRETIDAFDNAVWDEKHEDVRLDDGSTNIDSLDAQEYSSEPYMKIMIDMG